VSIRGSHPPPSAPFAEEDARADAAEYDALFALPPPVGVEAPPPEPAAAAAHGFPAFTALWRRIHRRGRGGSAA
jgi:hypothetical protein